MPKCCQGPVGFQVVGGCHFVVVCQEARDARVPLAQWGSVPLDSFALVLVVDVSREDHILLFLHRDVLHQDGWVLGVVEAVEGVVLAVVLGIQVLRLEECWRDENL